MELDLLTKAKLEEELGRSLEQDKLTIAIIGAQENMVVSEDASGNRNTYTSIEEILNKTQPHLRKNGLWVNQGETTIAETVYLDTVVNHNSGQWKRWRVPIPKITLQALTQSEANAASQAIGTIITYKKRYQYASIFGLRIGEMDPDSIKIDKIEEKPKAKINFNNHDIKRITDEQWNKLQKFFSAIPGLEDYIKEKINFNNLKNLYASKYDEVMELINNYEG